MTLNAMPSDATRTTSGAWVPINAMPIVECSTRWSVTVIRPPPEGPIHLASKIDGSVLPDDASTGPAAAAAGPAAAYRGEG